MTSSNGVRKDATLPRNRFGATPPTGMGILADAVNRADARVDSWFEPLRRFPAAEATARIISGLGDHGLAWAASAAWRARQPGPRRSRAVRALAIAGVESSLVNAALKGVVGRPRPEPDALRLGGNVVPLRSPTTTSFPSGHTLAAFCAASLLAEEGQPAGNAMLLVSAALVGLSRIQLRAHHASDVLGGALIGSALGAIGRRLV